MAGEEQEEQEEQEDLHSVSYRIPYGTSKKPGLEGEAEDFEWHYSRDYAENLAQKLTSALNENPTIELRRACERFLNFCYSTLSYGRELSDHEKKEGKISPVEAFMELRTALNTAFPIESTQEKVPNNTTIKDILE